MAERSRNRQSPAAAALLPPLLLAMLPALTLLPGCDLYCRSLTVQVVLPEPPEHWQQAFAPLPFRLVYPLAVGGRCVDSTVAVGQHILIELPKSLNLPVLAYPLIFDCALRLPPAGAVYPWDCDASARFLFLSWEQGAAAEILCRLWSAGLECSNLNLTRLRTEMRERSAGDPWNLDLEHILARLACREFRVSDIRLAPCSDLALEVEPGLWFLESPFRSPLPVEGPGQPLRLKAVPLGAHLLLSGSGEAALFLYADQEQLYCLPLHR